MSKDFIGYQALVDKALRGVVRDALSHVAKGGIVGSHHFKVVFATTAPGVDIPDFLREQYPEAMMIVLQNQYANLKIGNDAFEVTLNFQKIPATIVVPFTAILAFEDPSQKFQLGFQMQQPEAKAGLPVAREPAPPPAKLEQPEPKPDPAPAPKPDQPGEVVSLDKFRKK
jgi:hypothetical protein